MKQSINNSIDYSEEEKQVQIEEHYENKRLAKNGKALEA